MPATLFNATAEPIHGHKEPNQEKGNCLPANKNEVVISSVSAARAGKRTSLHIGHLTEKTQGGETQSLAYYLVTVRRIPQALDILGNNVS